ncbi:hypothetical protein [Paenibacillus sp. Marseille-Q4541]|uniref:hypothetical protein n=1 Tax=Paenibacillus sp. Marseille-Q4541 TaxID=2831522 RepID=UPI001BA818F4|nr:hypothetical protein [Paenibacillus sp. Marseille-Q4541]
MMSETTNSEIEQSKIELLEQSKREYMNMWDHISTLNPADSKKIVDGIQHQVLLTTEKKKIIDKDFAQYMKTPTPYIAMLVGSLLPAIFVFLYLWYSLILE